MTDRQKSQTDTKVRHTQKSDRHKSQTDTKERQTESTDKQKRQLKCHLSCGFWDGINKIIKSINLIQ